MWAGSQKTSWRCSDAVRYLVSLVNGLVVWRVVISPAVLEAVKTLRLPPESWVANPNTLDWGAMAPNNLKIN